MKSKRIAKLLGITTYRVRMALNPKPLVKKPSHKKFKKAFNSARDFKDETARQVIVMRDWLVFCTGINDVVDVFHTSCDEWCPESQDLAIRKLAEMPDEE